MMKSRRIVLVSHCVLNQNSVVEGWSRAKGAFPIVKLLLEEGIGIVQMPCPELVCGGLSRPPRNFDDYNTAGYRARCRDLLLPYIGQIKEYLAYGYDIAGVIGIENSPTCAFSGVRGVMADELYKMLEQENIELPYMEIPEDYREGRPSPELDKKISEFIRSNK